MPICGNHTSVQDLVTAAGAGAGVGGPHLPHRWRHTSATSLLRRGVGIHKVQRLVGHGKIVTTIRYLHLSDADLADAVDAAFPEAGRGPRSPSGEAGRPPQGGPTPRR